MQCVQIRCKLYILSRDLKEMWKFWHLNRILPALCLGKKEYCISLFFCGRVRPLFQLMHKLLVASSLNQTCDIEACRQSLTRLQAINTEGPPFTSDQHRDDRILGPRFLRALLTYISVFLRRPTLIIITHLPSNFELFMNHQPTINSSLSLMKSNYLSYLAV